LPLKGEGSFTTGCGGKRPLDKVQEIAERIAGELKG
jgi:hypothetical protein